MISLENMKLKSWLKFLTASSMIFCLAACGKKESSKEPQQNKEVAEAAGPKVDVVATPEELMREYEANTVSADQKYKGKTIEVTGVVSEISTGIDGKPYISMNTSSTFSSPVFNFSKDYLNQMAKLRKGQEVTVICKGAGDAIKIPILKECIFAPPSGNLTAQTQAPIQTQNAAEQVQAPSQTQQPINTNQLSYNSLDGIYYTDRHSIRIIERNGGYTYQAWKQPKSLDEGKPDLQVTKGWATQIGRNQCGTDKLTFKNGNLTMDVLAVTNDNRGCFASNPPNDAVGELTIYINGEKKDHYWMYR